MNHHNIQSILRGALANIMLKMLTLFNACYGDNNVSGVPPMHWFLAQKHQPTLDAGRHFPTYNCRLYVDHHDCLKPSSQSTLPRTEARIEQSVVYYSIVYT